LGGFMGGFLVPVIRVIIALIDIYWWIIIISAVMSWLIAFNVINTYNRPVAMIGDFLYRATEPALRPIRQFLPNLGGLDISPIILLLILWFIEQELYQLGFYVARL
jgi:YggT family protein